MNCRVTKSGGRDARVSGIVVTLNVRPRTTPASPSRRISRAVTVVTPVPLLIIDDLGMRKLPHTAAEDLLDIVMRRYERASTLQQEFQDRVLAGGDLDEQVIPVYAPRRRVHAHCAGDMNGGAVAGHTPQKGANPGHELCRRKWFEQVIVGAEIEGFHTVVHLVPCGQHEHGSF